MHHPGVQDLTSCNTSLRFQEQLVKAPICMSIKQAAHIHELICFRRMLLTGLPEVATAADDREWGSSSPNRAEMSRAAKSQNGASTSSAGVAQNAASAAVAAAEVTEQRQVLRQLQDSMHELQTQFLSDEKHLGSANYALQVCVATTLTLHAPEESQLGSVCHCCE